MWDDIAILLRYLLMLSFNNSLDGTPRVFHSCLQHYDAPCGPQGSKNGPDPFFKPDVHGHSIGIHFFVL